MAYQQHGQYQQAPSRPSYEQQAPRGAPRGYPQGPPRAQQQYVDPNAQYGQQRQNYPPQGPHESYTGYDGDGFLESYGGERDGYGYDQQYQQYQQSGRQQHNHQDYNLPRQQRQPQQYSREPMQMRQDHPPHQQGYDNVMNGQLPRGGRGQGPLPQHYGPPQSQGPPQGDMQYYDDREQVRGTPRGTPPRQMQGKPRLLQPTSPKTMGFDNPFPVFPTSQISTPKSDVKPIERAMANLDLKGRPSLENRRPPTSGSGTSQYSSRSNNSRFHADPRAERPEDRYAPRPSFEGRGPPLRTMTLPDDMGYPANNRPPQDQNSWQDPKYDVGGHHQGHPAPQRSFTNIDDRPSPGPVQAPQRPSTASGVRPQVNGYPPHSNSFPMNDYQPRTAPAPTMGQQEYMPPRSGTPQGDYSPLGQPQRPHLQSKESALEAYMPNYEMQPASQPLHDPIGLPLDAAPEAAHVYPHSAHPQDLHQVRSATPTRAPKGDAFYQQAERSRSQPNLRGQTNGYEYGGQPNVPVPQLPPGSTGSFGGQRRSPPRSLVTNIALPFANGPNGPGSIPNSPRQFQRPGAPSIMRNETAQSGWSDPGPGAPRGSNNPSPANQAAAGAPKSVALPDRTAIKPGPPKPVNPDALPINPIPADTLPAPPAPVRPGHTQNGMQPQQIRQAQAKRQSMSDSPRPSLQEKRGSQPVTFEELFRLREQVQRNQGDQPTQLFLAKRLVEASVVLASEGGRADPKTAQKNREKYIFEAHKNIKKLVAANYPEAMFFLADCYGTGQLGLAVDAKEAFGYYQAAAKLNHPPSAYRTAVCCEMGHEAGGGTRKDPLKAVQWYKRAAALGDVPAMYKLGMILLKGLLGQPASLGEAMIWLQRAADRADDENPHALHELANIYENAPNGGKVIRDEKYAFQCYKHAAKLGYRQSQSRLGTAYEYGQLGCPIDNRNSIHWYSKAAAQEDHEAELALSGWYLTGAADVLKQSDSEAYLWARKAALAEMPKAEFAMGYFSETGIGCPKSLEDAKRWYGRAATHKYPKAQERLEELRRGGTKGLKTRERHSRSEPKKNEDCTVM